MGVSKTDAFSKHHNQLATLAKALGHPARVAIIEHLLKVNTCICNDIVEQLPLSQPTISQHLRELNRVGLIRGKIAGNSIYYSIDREVWKRIENIFISLFKKYKGKSKTNR
ncbi:MAG: metalloregulator ArsR/SmtB family transcription factor [Bacteroidota bacterium]|nr:metalloregulator ArsR/SmtB family transcription factor [Bacteroidota bacterium]